MVVDYPPISYPYPDRWYQILFFPQLIPIRAALICSGSAGSSARDFIVVDGLYWNLVRSPALVSNRFTSSRFTLFAAWIFPYDRTSWLFRSIFNETMGERTKSPGQPAGRGPLDRHARENPDHYLHLYQPVCCYRFSYCCQISSSCYR